MRVDAKDRFTHTAMPHLRVTEALRQVFVITFFGCVIVCSHQLILNSRHFLNSRHWTTRRVARPMVLILTLGSLTNVACCNLALALLPNFLSPNSTGQEIPQAIASRKSATEIPNFAGTWVLNRKLSQSASDVFDKTEAVLVVTQTAKQLTVEQKLRLNGREQPSQALAYNLNSQPSEAQLSRPVAGKAALTARWLAKEQRLELRTTIKTQLMDAKGEPTDEAKLVTLEYWELLDHGKTLKLVRTRDWPGRHETSRLIFELQR
jgi:hypothetical protein